MFLEFRECFYLFAREGTINKLDELSIIMRSLGMSPTITELKKYFSENSKYKVLFSHSDLRYEDNCISVY